MWYKKGVICVKISVLKHIVTHKLYCNPFKTAHSWSHYLHTWIKCSKMICRATYPVHFVQEKLILVLKPIKYFPTFAFYKYKPLHFTALTARVF